MKNVSDRARRLAKLAILAMLAAACDEPAAKTPADAKDGGAPHEIDRSGMADKAHCA
jgi:hypothetical protein